jgi:hypothetical protein
MCCTGPGGVSRGICSDDGKGGYLSLYFYWRMVYGALEGIGNLGWLERGKELIVNAMLQLAI